MASTTTNMTGINGSKTDFAFTFPYIKTTDLKVDLIHSTHGKTTLDSTKFTYPNATTISLSSGSATNWQETSGAPKTGVTGTIWRDTGSTNLAATFYPGSAIRSSDLNDNFEQNLYVTQEAENDANDALTNSRELVSGSYVSAISTANTAKTAADAAKMATDRLVATTSDGGSSWTLTGGNTNASSDPKGVKYAVEEAEDAVSTAGTANTNANNAVNTANAALPKSGGTMSGAIAMGTNKITGLGDPGADQDAATRKYVTDNFYTKTQSDSTFFNVSTSDTIKDGDAFPDNDSTIATTAAINDRIIDLVDDVGGFWPIANELAFPNANPDIDNNTGTIVSIKTLSTNYTSNGSGVISISNGTVGNSTVTITGAENSTTYSSGYGMLVETTTTLNEYTFHRLTPKATEVTTVAANVSNIGTVASNDSNITAVAGNATNINTVASNATNINSVASNATNVNTVATNITDVSNFADLYQIATSAPDKDGGNNDLAAGDLWFDSSSNKTLKVHNGTTFQSVSPTQSVLDDISIVSGSLTRKEDLGSIADDIAEDSSTGALDTCATNITNINTFANVYRIASSAPSSSLDEGDLWYDSTGNVLKYYNGTAWVVTAAAGLSEVSEDTTPKLGGHLDCNDKNLTEVGTVSGDNLQIDFGAIA